MEVDLLPRKWVEVSSGVDGNFRGNRLKNKKVFPWKWMETSKEKHSKTA